MLFPPGLLFLARALVPAILALCLLQFIFTWVGLTMSIWATAALCVVSLSILAIVWPRALALYYELQARRLGARLAPYVKGRWPGNIDVLSALLEDFESGYLGDGFGKLAQTFGPVFELEFLARKHLFTTCPEHVQIMLAADFPNYVKGERFKRSMKSVLGDGVFNSDGEMWAFHRSVTRPYFARDRVRHFDLFDRLAEKMISLIKDRMDTGMAINFQDAASRFTMDAATEFLFGTCVDSLSGPLPLPFYARNTPNPRSTEMRRVGWVWPLFEIFEDKTLKPMRTVNAFVDPIIAKAVEKKKQSDGSTDAKVEHDTLLDELLNSTTDHKLLRDETFVLVLVSRPGRDTTMHTITMVVYFLAMYPEVMRRLRDEVISVVGLSERPLYEDIKAMKYLRAPIQRPVFVSLIALLTPSYSYTSESVKPAVWPSPDPTQKPIYIPAGLKIWYSTMLMQRRHDLWGPDADDFDPDRFIDERVQKYLVNNPWQFLPFNGGPRICLGQQFAYNEMSFILIRLLQAFESISLDFSAWSPSHQVPLEWAGQPGRKGVERFRPQAHLTMYTMGGMWVKMNSAA
ncbi:cytochrome P450 [Mycena amicta]|nr:cytochrome P450 [Mycena amicta]